MSESGRASAPAGVNICFRNLNNRPPVICISDNGQPYGSVDPRCAEVLFFSLYLSLSFIYQLPSYFSHFFSSSPSIFSFPLITYLGTFCSFYKHPFSPSVIHKTLDMTHHTELWPKLPWQQSLGCPLFVQHCFQQVTENSDVACLAMTGRQIWSSRGSAFMGLKSCCSASLTLRCWPCKEWSIRYSI